MLGNKIILGYISFTILSMVVVPLFYACSSADLDEKVTELPPSLIYADDDSTVLGKLSNVKGKQFDLAPYFCASLEKDIAALFAQKDANGDYMYHKKDGSPYDVYEDELSIYTSLNPTMQRYAEEAMQKHLTDDLQPAFAKNNSQTKHYPFSDSYDGHKITSEDVKQLMSRAREQSNRFVSMTKAGISTEKINASFNEPTSMKLFSWRGEIDTILTPNDSIRYAKNLIRSSLLSIEPSLGHVKAWVGGINFEHFPFDNVKIGSRQVGSTIKPFVYATAFAMGVVDPCTEFSGKHSYCIDPCDPKGSRWCPSGTYSGTVQGGFCMSSGGGSLSFPIMSLMGACAGPQSIVKLLNRMNIDVPDTQITPSIAFGTPDVSLFELVGAHAAFVNNGTFISPQSVLRITDREGNEIYRSKPRQTNVLNPTITYEMLTLMKSVVQIGTATSLRWSPKWGGITQPTGAVTGTTQGNSDGWFIGLTPDLVTGVWAGGENMQIRFRSMTWGQGARMSLPTYGYYMQKVYSDPELGISTDDFIRPVTYNSTYFKCGHSEHPFIQNQSKSKNPFSI
jgi:penicillin-binding protein 1A